MVRRKMNAVLIRTQQFLADKPERVADVLTGSALGTWLVNQLVNINVVLESLTLLVGLIAGIFALLFHFRKWRNERAARSDLVAKKVLHELRKDGLIKDLEKLRKDDPSE